MRLRVLTVALSLCAGAALGAELPGRYFSLLHSGCASVEGRLNREREPTLATLEADTDWKHFPYAILAPAVLYAKRHPQNSRYHDRQMLALAIRIGDLLATENEKGTFEPRLDSDWDTYMWLEAYRLLAPELGEQRRERWRRQIVSIVAPLEAPAEKRINFPWYNSPFITTSPNHYAQWASLLYLAGRVFQQKQWEVLGARILHRFATEEQTLDGYWGEHSRSGPTTGYDYLTSTQVALYWEYSRDPAALAALRRSTDFHEYFTYPDGTPVEVINDRNRYWEVPAWGQFGFSNFADGRRYAQFLAGFARPDQLSMNALGRLAQDALYYHEGPRALIPQDRFSYWRRLSVPAAIRKTGAWVIALSGIIDTPAPLNQFYIDRQANVSVFHQKVGLIISGANSKRQPELATFSERVNGNIFNLPQSSRLESNPGTDRLALSYNTFFSVVEPKVLNDRQVKLTFTIHPTDHLADSQLALQLGFKAGQQISSASGSQGTLTTNQIALTPSQINGSIGTDEWSISVPPTARFSWPIHPYNPYADAPEPGLEHAVGVITVPLARDTPDLSFVISVR